MIPLNELLKLKFPDANPLVDYQLSDHGDGIIVINTWNISDKEPTEKDLQQWSDELDLQYRQKIAIEKRVYPDICKQLDMQYHDLVEGTTVWKDTIAAIKSDNPKPTE